jgi:dihydrofolate reductase
MSRKTIVFIAASLDGFIAGPDDNLSFLDLVAKEGEDYGYAAFMQMVDTVILGRKTYDWVMKQVPVFPHADLESYVITRTEKPALGKTVFYTGEPAALVKELAQKEGKNIFIDGGAELVNSLLKEKLVDEIYLSLIPIILGDGVRLFHTGNPIQVSTLVSAKQFGTGLVQLHYVLAKQ